MFEVRGPPHLRILVCSGSRRGPSPRFVNLFGNPFESGSYSTELQPILSGSFSRPSTSVSSVHWFEPFSPSYSVLPSGSSLHLFIRSFYVFHPFLLHARRWDVDLHSISTKIARRDDGAFSSSTSEVPAILASPRLTYLLKRITLYEFSPCGDRSNSIEITLTGSLYPIFEKFTFKTRIGPVPHGTNYLGEAGQLGPMSIVLYSLDGCPYCEKVEEALDEQGIDYETRWVEGLHSKRDEVKRISGQRSVPVLIDEDRGVTMGESDNIVEYVETSLA